MTEKEIKAILDVLAEMKVAELREEINGIKEEERI